MNKHLVFTAEISVAIIEQNMLLELGFVECPLCLVRVACKCKQHEGSSIFCAVCTGYTVLLPQRTIQ